MKIKIKKGEKVTVELTRKKPPVQGQKSKVQSQDLPATGIMRPRREPEYLARRLKPQKGLIFYDLGTIKNESGEWIDYKFAGTTDESGLISPVSFATKAAAILANNVATFENKFRRLTRDNAALYEFEIRTASGWKVLNEAAMYWSANGEKVIFENPGTELSEWFGWRKNPLVIGSNIGDGAPDVAASRIKITSAPDFLDDSPLENLQIEGNETFFLCPVFCRATARDRLYQSGAGRGRAGSASNFFERAESRLPKLPANSALELVRMV